MRIRCGLGALGVGVLGLSILIGCAGPRESGQGPFGGQYPIKAVCTTGMVADLVKRVGGPHVDAIQLMGDGVDPHLYRATAGDTSKLNEADIVFYSGLQLEGKMTDVFARLVRKKPTVAVAGGLPQASLLEAGEGHFDPHVWFDVSLWHQAVPAVGEALAAFDPPHAAEYRKNAENYQAELSGLHEECKKRLAEIPQGRRVLVTAHDAFRYFGRAYDVEVKAIQGISTDTEASVKEINALVEFITQRGIKAVFVESSVSERSVRALIEGCEARGHPVVVGGELFSDAMGKPDTPEGTYPGMLRFNVHTIVKALN